MPHTNNLSAYDDIKAVLDTALAEGTPLHYHLASGVSDVTGLGSAAVRFRSRFYHFRSLTSVPEYRHLIVRIDKKVDPCTVVIDREIAGTLTRPDGTPVTLKEPKEVLSDEEIAAMQLARELGLE